MSEEDNAAVASDTVSDDAQAVADSLQTTDTTTDTSTEPKAEPKTDASEGWMISEGVKGEGDKPEWFKDGKYKSVLEQAKAYNELEGKLGSFTGSPEEYAIELSEELTEQGVSIDADDTLMAEAMKFAKDSNMSQEGFNNMVNLYAMTKVAEQTAANDAKTEEIKALGPTGEKRLSNLAAWGKANFSEELYAGFEEMLVSSTSIQAVERLISMTRNAPVTPDSVNSASGVSAEEVRAMQFELDEYGNRKIQTDPDFKARFRKLSEEVWGGEQAIEVIG